MAKRRTFVNRVVLAELQKEKENSLCKILKDENDSLIAQRNVLSKTKESLIKDLEKKGRELERF